MKATLQMTDLVSRGREDEDKQVLSIYSVRHLKQLHSMLTRNIGHFGNNLNVLCMGAMCVCEQYSCVQCA